WHCPIHQLANGRLQLCHSTICWYRTWIVFVRNRLVYSITTYVDTNGNRCGSQRFLLCGNMDLSIRYPYIHRFCCLTSRLHPFDSRRHFFRNDRQKTRPSAWNKRCFPHMSSWLHKPLIPRQSVMAV